MIGRDALLVKDLPERREPLDAAAARLGALGLPYVARPALAQTAMVATETRKHHFIPATDKTVHWGYFSKSLKPLLVADSGDYITFETLTHHANDDAERMVK